MQATPSCASLTPAFTPGRRLIRLGSAAIVFSALALLTSAAGADGVVGGNAPFELPAERGFAQSTYYRVAYVDMRLCPSPLCGGVFVERVNRRTAKCADGTYGKVCHAAAVDFSALRLTPEQEAQLQSDFNAGRVLARGDLQLADIGIGIDIPTLVVFDAWRGATGTQKDYGRYFGVVSTGIVCITYPCPSFAGFKLNGRRVGWLHSVDLETSGATPEQISHGFDELFSGRGLIGFGVLKKIVGPAGHGEELRTSEFYTKVGRRGPAACGGFTYPPNPACATGEFCEQPANTCYLADVPGTCQVVPDACITLYDPVCGCDGTTYGNDCERQRAQVALDRVGACPPRAD